MYKMDFKKLLKKVGAYIVSVKQCKFVLVTFVLYLGVAENNLAANGQFFQNISDKIENLCVAPLCKRAERKAIPKSSLLTDIFLLKAN